MDSDGNGLQIVVVPDTGCIECPQCLGLQSLYGFFYICPSCPEYFPNVFVTLIVYMHNVV